MNFKSTLFKMAFGLIIVCCAIGVFVFWMADPLNLKAPKDQELFTLFHDHRMAFERLRQMANEEQKAWFISVSHLELDKVRKQEYKRLLSEIYPGLIVGKGIDTGVRFTFAWGGLSAISPGWLKGIDYIPGDYRKEGVIEQNLDEARKWAPGVYLRQIEPHWFIVYQRDDD